MSAVLFRQLACACLLSVATATVCQADEAVSIRVSMPTLTCNKGVLEPNECVLSGTMRVRGPETLSGPVRYYCDLRYSYIAAGNEQQAIRFTGRTIFHDEVKLDKGKARLELARQLTLQLNTQARQIEVSDLSCEKE